MEYQKFSTEDFIQDEFFIEWVTMPNAANDQFWKSWMASHPEKLDAIFEAKAFIEQLKKATSEPFLSAERTEKLWIGIQSQRIEEETPSFKALAEKRTKSIFWKMGIAASFLLLTSFVAFFWNLSPTAPIRYQTAYGEIKEILLPDSSQVFLNANSELLVRGDWTSYQEREVELKGEAYFVVSKQPAPEGNRKFVVHTADFDVVVVGTRFNVIHRKNRKRVVLEEGKIDLRLKEGAATPLADFPSPQNENIRLNPGEGLEIAPKTEEKQLRIEKVNTQVHSSWKARQLVFENTPLTDLLSIIEDNYGYSVLVQDPELLNKKLSGTVPSNNLGTLLKSLEVIFGIEVSRKNEKQLVFSIPGPAE